MSPMGRASTVSSLRAAVTAGGPQAEPQAEPERAPREETKRPPEPPPRPPKPIRFTLDLSKDLHGFLKRFALEAEVDAAKIMRTLLVLLRDDPELAQRVKEAAWST